MREFSMAAIACVVLCENWVFALASASMRRAAKHESSLALVAGLPNTAQRCKATRALAQYECFDTGGTRRLSKGAMLRVCASASLAMSRERCPVERRGAGTTKAPLGDREV